MNSKPLVVIGLLGTSLDNFEGPERWDRWRPTVSLFQHEDLLISRLELLTQDRYRPLAARVADDIRHVSPETTANLVPIEFENPWSFEEVYGALHDFARAYPFDVEREEYLVHITTGSHVAQISLFLLTESRHLPAKLIQTAPPQRRKKRFTGGFEIIDLDLSKYDRIAARFHKEQREATAFLKSGIETRSANFNRLIDRIEQVAGVSPDPILLTGPTGAGKSRLAKRIYELKKNRRQVAGAFVEVNCATIRGDGAMSALFGHVKGAFTGAVGARPGLLKAADGGLLFLDEIGELGLDEQAMLLRALEEKTFLPLGSDRETASDFQLIAGTNRDLRKEVNAGRFREDLLARIDLWTFQLPGLRDRREDIEPNLDYELEQFERRTGTRVTFSREAREAFLDFATAPDAAWRGNFRDLNGAVIRLATLAAGGRISKSGVEEEIERLRRGWGDEPASTTAAPDLDPFANDERFAEFDLFDRMQLASVLRVCAESKNLSEAGRKLFAASREKKNTVNDADRLRKFLARFGLDWKSLGSLGES